MLSLRCFAFVCVICPLEKSNTSSLQHASTVYSTLYHTCFTNCRTTWDLKTIQSKHTMTNEQVYMMAAAKSEQLSHIKSWEQRYFRHLMTILQDNIKASVMTAFWREWETKNFLDWRHHSMTGQSRCSRSWDRWCWSVEIHPHSQLSLHHDNEDMKH